MGTQLSLPQKGAEPPHQFLAHVYCGQTAGWIKMALGVEVGHGPDHIVLGRELGTQLPCPKKGSSPEIIGPSLLWPNGWMDRDVTWYGGRTRLKR